MAKATITRTWIAGAVAVAAGLLAVGIGVGLMLAYGGHFTPAPYGNGYDFHPTLNGFFWSMVALMSVGGIVAALGGIVQLVAWIGALINTYRLQDKTWFAVLLVGGLLGLGTGLIGFAVMLAYVLAGPDGAQVAVEAPRRTDPLYRQPPTAVPLG